MVASNSAKHRMDRIIRLHEEIDQIKKDIRDIYAEEKAEGGDKTAMGEAITKIRKREKDKTAFDERENMVDVYLMAYSAPSRTHTHAREDRSDSGLNIQTKHEDIRTAPETARNEPEAAAEVAGDYLREPVAAEQGQIIREGDAPRETDRLGGDASCPDTDKPGTATELSDALVPTRGEHQAIASSEHGRSHGQAAGRSPESQMDGETDPVTAGETAPHSDQPLTGGDHEVASIAERERETVTSNTGEGAANTALPESDKFIEDVPPTPMKRLNYAHCFPELTKAEYGRLEFSIIGIGVSKPIIRMGDVIVDGWARYNICRTLGISYPIKNYSGNDVLLDVIEWQRASRNFTPAQEKKIAADLAKEIPHRADDIMAAFGLAEAMEAAE